MQENARDHDRRRNGSTRADRPSGAPRPSTIAYAARIGLELGADFTKVKYPRDKEAMAHAVRSAADNRVLLSGGSKTSDRDFLELVEDCMDVGVAGLAVGRNVWQRDDPYDILDELEGVIFEDATADDVL